MNLENIMKFGKYPKLEKHHETVKYEIQKITSNMKNIMKQENIDEIWKISLKLRNYH